MKGWKTLCFNFFIAVAPSALTYLAAVHWDQYVNPNIAFAIVGLIGMGLRAVTTTPVGKNG